MRCSSIAVIAAASTIVFTQVASAADLPRKAPAPPPPPVYSWTGFYVGGNVGYGWKDPTVTVTGNDVTATFVTCGGIFGGTCIPPVAFNVNGAVGGLQGGYNWQLNQNWLVGLEADFDWSNVKGSGSSNFLLAGSPSTFQASENITWFGTIRGRVGFLPANKFLLYATGGFAYGRVAENTAINSPITNVVGATSFRCTSLGGPGAANCFVGTSSRTATGFAVGAGAEYVLWQNLSVKVEYLYVNLGGGNNVNVVNQSPFSGVTSSSFTAAYNRPDFNVVRAGLNWKL